MRFRRLLPALATGGALALAGCGGEDEPSGTARAPAADATPARPSRAEPGRIAGGTTTLDLSSSLGLLLKTAGGKVTPISPAPKSDAGYAIPISGGEIGVEPLAGRLRHDGGISLGVGSNTVAVTGISLDLHTGGLSAEVEGARIELVTADFAPAELSPDRRSVTIKGSDAKLADAAVAPLNDALGYDVLSGGLSIGELEIRARWP